MRLFVACSWTILRLLIAKIQNAFLVWDNRRKESQIMALRDRIIRSGGARMLMEHGL